MRKLLLLIALTLVYISCENSSKSKNFEVPDTEEMEVSASYLVEQPEVRKIPTDRKIIWNADIEFQVENVDESTKEISNLCSKYNAFISRMNLTNNSYEMSNQITIRVDNTNFNNLINDIKGTSTFIRKIEIKSNDVTEEYIDIESRLETKKQVRDRYIDILRNRSGEIKDVIAAEDAIRKITEEIEAKEGRLRYLQDKVSQSTIRIEIYQKVDYKSEPEIYEKNFGSKAKESLETGWNIITHILLFLLSIWPLIVITVLAVFWRRRWIRRKLNK